MRHGERLLGVAHPIALTGFRQCRAGAAMAGQTGKNQIGTIMRGDLIWQRPRLFGRCHKPMNINNRQIGFLSCFTSPDHTLFDPRFDIGKARLLCGKILINIIGQQTAIK